MQDVIYCQVCKARRVNRGNRSGRCVKCQNAHKSLVRCPSCGRHLDTRSKHKICKHCVFKIAYVVVSKLAELAQRDEAGRDLFQAALNLIERRYSETRAVAFEQAAIRFTATIVEPVPAHEE